jgi:hypothetical protein
MKTQPTVSACPKQASCTWPQAIRARWGLLCALFVLFAATLSNASAVGFTNDCLIVRCPPQVVTNYICDDAFVTQTYPIVVSNKCSSVQVQVHCNPPPGTPLPPGVHPIQCVVTANGQVMAECSFQMVIIRDITPPEIRCPSNMVASACPSPTGACGALVTYPAPMATDNSGSVAVVCNPPSGSMFPCGVSTVTCVATDRCGNKDECSFTVTVNQQGNGPTIQCSGDVTVNTCTNGAVVNFNVAGTAPIVCTPPSGSVFPVGINSVLCVASNACGTAECSFKVTVVPGQAEPPSIKCPSNMVVTATCASNCVPVNFPLPVVLNGGFAGCNFAPGTCFPIGVTTVTCRATNNCGQVATCSFNIRVVPGGEPPKIQCSGDVVVETCSPNGTIATYAAPFVSPPSAGVICTPASGGFFPVGTTTVTCVASNNCGVARCTFDVVVRLKPPVTIQCPTNLITITAPCGSNCVPVSYPPPFVANGVLESCNPPPGTCLPIGLHTVVCRATNDCGTVASCEFQIRVVPGQGDLPRINCPSNIVVRTCESNKCEVVNYPLPTVFNGTLVNCFPPPGTCFNLGVTPVTCVASNDCGTNSCKFTVTVRPIAPPVIRCPTNDITVLAPCGSNCVPVYFPAPFVSNGALEKCDIAPGTCLPVGIHPVVCTATNICGVQAKCEFVVRVVPGQGEPPVLNCPSNIVVEVCATNCAPVQYPLPIVFNGTLAGCNPPPGNCFPIGTTPVTCIATNGCGTNSCTFTVTVRAKPAVSIKCPTNNITLLAPCGSNCVPVSYPAPIVMNGTLVGCDVPPGTCLPVGQHVITCRATNDCGQTALCEFVVRVLPGEGRPPVINCPSNILVEVCNTNCTPVQYPLPTVFNGTLVNCSVPSGTCFPAGVTPVTCVATNGCGTNSCTFTVTVRPVPPVFVRCPSNIVVTTCSSGEVVTYPPPVIIGNTNNVVSVYANPPSGSFFPIGTNRVTYCLVDRCGRTNCCEFLVIVKPGTPCVKPPSSMVLWLPFDEPVGPMAANIIPGAPNGWHSGGVTPFLGQYVLNSLRFDGINDFVRVPNYAAIMLNNSDITIDAWVRRETPDQGRRVIVSKLGQVPFGAGVRGYEFYLNNGVMHLFLGGAVAQNYNSGIVVPADGNWHHVAVTVRRPAGGRVRFYLNGGLVNQQAGPITAPLGNNNSLFVGASTWPVPNSFFRGHIDEVEIFRRELTPGEIFGLWNAKQAGKCKVKVVVPPHVAFRPNQECVNVKVRISNCTGLPQEITWVADAPAPILTPHGALVLPPYGTETVTVTICRPEVSVFREIPWSLSVFPGRQCPIVTVGTLIDPGAVEIELPTDPVSIRGTNETTIDLDLNGLTVDANVRLRVVREDGEDDTQFVSLNGLPPGTPLQYSATAGASGQAKALQGQTVTVAFAEADPVGHYTILIEADTDGDGEFEPLSSFDVENPVVPPPTLQIVNGQLIWNDEGNGIGVLEVADSIDGPWTPVEGGPGTAVEASGSMKFYRIAIPTTE